MTKKITILTFFIFLTGCGYSPLLNTEKINFYIADLNFSGDKKISNYEKKPLLDKLPEKLNLNHGQFINSNFLTYIELV